MLKPAFRKDRHVESSDRFHAAPYDLALERVKRRHVVLGQRRERDSFGDFDHGGSRVGTESIEAVATSRRIGTDVAPAQPATVSQRELDAAEAPAFLVPHQVIDDAADRELAANFERIVLEAFVAAVAVHEITPVWIPFADSAAQSQSLGGALDIERLVVLNDPHRFHGVQILWTRVNLLEKQ